MDSASEDPSLFLTVAGQWTEPWGPSSDDADCEKCRGTGRTQHVCWSCALTTAGGSCPVCSGRVRWEDVCPVCRGGGRIDGEPRHGVSAFPTIEGLYHYMLDTHADLAECVIVEMDADLAADVDFDADQGAMLVMPKRIRRCDPVDRSLIERIGSRAASG